MDGESQEKGETEESTRVKNTFLTTLLLLFGITANALPVNVVELVCYF